MTITIDAEAKQKAKSILNSDNFANRYKTSNGIFTFPSPSFWTIDKNLFFLLRNSTEKQFEAQYRYRPDFLSFDEYGTEILWYLLMYVNTVACIEDFDLETVIVPNFSAIVSIAADKFPVRSVDILEGIKW
jgi:alpha-L-fucosidase